MPWFFVEDGANRGATYELPPGGGEIGRQPGVPVLLADPLVSRRHARVMAGGSADQDRAWIEDLGSRHGTALNGVPVLARTALAHGDKVRMGSTVLRYEAGEPTLAEIERAHVRRAMELAGGVRTTAARLLGIDRKTLRKKLSESP